jgi:hypothetical protein
MRAWRASRSHVPFSNSMTVARVRVSYENYIEVLNVKVRGCVLGYCIILLLYRRPQTPDLPPILGTPFFLSEIGAFIYYSTCRDMVIAWSTLARSLLSIFFKRQGVSNIGG